MPQPNKAHPGAVLVAVPGFSVCGGFGYVRHNLPSKSRQRAGGVYFGKSKKASVFAVMGRADLPPNDDFISKDGAGGCDRSRRKRNRHTDRNEKRREPPRRSSPPGDGDL